MTEENKNEQVSNAIDSEATEVNESTTNKTSSDGTTNQDPVKKEPAISNEVISRIFITLLFALIGWLSLWVFGVVVLVQFGFLLITGQLNKNLKAFNGELGEFLSDIIKYVSFQTDDKPFPFQSWSYGETTESTQSEAKPS